MSDAAAHEAASPPAILFGAFDRHNFGDLLFPHVAAALLPGRKLSFVGLAQRDLRHYGGHRVKPLSRVAARWGEHPAIIIHAGGELLTCDAWEAAVMLLPPQRARQIIARLDHLPRERLEWAHSALRLPGLAPYTVPRQLFPHSSRILYNAVGGVDLERRDPALRAEVAANLRAADIVSVRDRQTQALLDAAGVAARLMPDPAVMVAELFGARIRRHAAQGETAQIVAAFPRGYIAVQFSADFGDDRTLTEIAAQLDRISIPERLGVAFFRAGAAPWHDELSCYRRAAGRMRSPSVRIFGSLNLWDICALIACSRAYLGSSLHGRIVAMAFALPRMNLRHPATTGWPVKQEAFAAAWEDAGMRATVEAHDIAEGIREAMAADPERLRHIAERLTAHYRQEFAAIRAGLQ